MIRIIFANDWDFIDWKEYEIEQVKQEIINRLPNDKNKLKQILNFVENPLEVSNNKNTQNKYCTCNREKIDNQKNQTNNYIIKMFDSNIYLKSMEVDEDGDYLLEWVSYPNQAETFDYETTVYIKNCLKGLKLNIETDENNRSENIQNLSERKIIIK